MSTLQSRIGEAFEYRNSLSPKHGIPSKAGLAKASKITPGAVSQWFDGSTKSIKGGALIRAANYLEVSPGWLASGVGAMLVQENETDRHGLSPLHQATIDAFINAVSKGRLTDMDCLNLMKSWLELPS